MLRPARRGGVEAVVADRGVNAVSQRDFDEGRAILLDGQVQQGHAVRGVPPGREVGAPLEEVNGDRRLVGEESQRERGFAARRLRGQLYVRGA